MGMEDEFISKRRLLLEKPRQAGEGMATTVKAVVLKGARGFGRRADTQFVQRGLVFDRFPAAALFSDVQWAVLREAFSITGRQLEMARLICEGHTYEGIAVRSGLSINTVRMHIRELFNRLDAHDRVSVVVRLVLANRILCAPHRPTASA